MGGGAVCALIRMETIYAAAGYAQRVHSRKHVCRVAHGHGFTTRAFKRSSICDFRTKRRNNY
jgi:hypothetical protein